MKNQIPVITDKNELAEKRSLEHKPLWKDDECYLTVTEQEIIETHKRTFKEANEFVVVNVNDEKYGPRTKVLIFVNGRQTMMSAGPVESEKLVIKALKEIGAKDITEQFHKDANEEFKAEIKGDK